jgi:hypothetical protein
MPTDAATIASSVAEPTLMMRRPMRAPSCTREGPPTVPSESGISRSPIRSSPSRFHTHSGRYAPLRAAKA